MTVKNESVHKVYYETLKHSLLFYLKLIVKFLVKNEANSLLCFFLSIRCFARTGAVSCIFISSSVSGITLGTDVGRLFSSSATNVNNAVAAILLSPAF